MAIQFDDDAQFQEYRDIIFEVRAESRHKDRGNIVFPIKVDLPAESMTAEQVIKGLNKFASHVKNYANDLQSIFCKYWEYLRIDYIKSKAEYDFLAGAPDWVKTLEPYLIPIAAEANKDFILADFYRKCFTADWQPVKESPYFDLIEEAEKRRAEHQKAQDLEAEKSRSEHQKAQDLSKLKVTAKQTDNIQFPLDKPNTQIWDLLIGAKPNDQLQIDTINIDMSKGKKKREAGIIYGISFDKLEKVAPNLKITKQLTQYDKRVYIAISAIYNAGNEVTTATQIYKAMGNTGQPKKAAVKKINDSLTKMGAARIYLSNEHEAKAYTNYPVFKYDASLLPFERITAIINHLEAEAAIHLFREPPLMTFAKERKQITTFDLQVLESPVNKTEANLAIDHYLLERISRIKKGNAQSKILYDTLYEKCKIATTKQKQRAPEKIKRLLDHYKSCKFIYDYKEEKDGISIYSSKAAKGKK